MIRMGNRECAGRNVEHLKVKKLYHAQFLHASVMRSKVSTAALRASRQKQKKHVEIKQFGKEDELKAYLKNVTTAWSIYGHSSIIER